MLPRITQDEFRNIVAVDFDVWVEVATASEIAGTTLDIQQSRNDQRDRNRQGRVVKIGPRQHDVAIGDWVWYAHGMGHAFMVGDKMIHVVRQNAAHNGYVMAKAKESERFALTAIQPLAEWVLVGGYETVYSTGGILLPEIQRQSGQQAVVIEVGGKVTQMAAGNEVLVASYGGYEIVVGSRRAKMLRESEVLAVLTNVGD